MGKIADPSPKIDDAEAIIFLRSFIDDIIRHPDLDNPIPIFCAENSLGHESSFLASEVSRYQYNILIAEKAGGPWGWNAGDGKPKKEWAFETWRAIHSRQVRFMENWICKNPFSDASIDKQRETVKAKALEQIRRYREFVHPSSNPSGHQKSGISGILDKDGHKSRTFNDDLAVAFTLAIFLWAKVFMREIPRFPYSDVLGDDPTSALLDEKRSHISDQELERAGKRKRVFIPDAYARAPPRMLPFTLPKKARFVS